MAELFRYAAFISYSSNDAAFAKRLHRALESYGIPNTLGKFDTLGGGGKPNRIYPVFRDREELPAGELSERIEQALRQSRSLIVVCSPSAAASLWVQKEIESFLAMGRREHIYAIIASNAPLTDKIGADATRLCFPPAFRGNALADPNALEPIAADARAVKDGFRNAWLKLVAGMIGVNAGALQDRDRRRRRTALLKNIAASAFVLISAGAAYAYRTPLTMLVNEYSEYRPFVHAKIALEKLPPKSTFQDCHEASVDCPVMIVLPAGTFMMGSPESERNREASESPQHAVTVGSIAVGKYDISFDEWDACASAGGCRTTPHPDDAHWGRETRPVINISWDDAKEYVAWLSQMTGQQYRLLSEAEWEYAARGHNSFQAPHYQFPWGNAQPNCDMNAPNGAAFGACEHKTLPVGSFQHNAFGLYDMAGNVWQWVEDCYQDHYDPSKSDGAPIEQNNCLGRVLRGGAWGGDPRELRSAYRGISGHTTRNLHIGFRVARTL